MLVLRLAWRNVWRNSRRSAVTIFAMTFALVMELIYAGLVSGMIDGMQEDVTNMEMGELQVFSENYLERPSIYETIDETPILAALDAEGFPASPRLYSGGLAAAGEASAGVGFIGIDPERDAKVSAIYTAVGKGEWLSTDDLHGVVIGRGLARTLGVDLGSEVVVLSQGTDGSVANELFTIRGILMSVASGTDRGTIFMNQELFREMMVLDEGAHKILVRQPGDMTLDEAKTAVVAASPGAEVKTWVELNPIMAQMLEGVQAQIAIVYFIVYVAVAILILNAMLMALFERVREFGVLKAIGYTPWQVFSMMLLEGMIQAVIALVLGFIVASPAMYYLQVHGLDVGSIGGMNMAGMTMPAIWKGTYTLETVSLPVIMLFVIVFVAVVIPASRAAWIRPVDAMSHT